MAELPIDPSSFVAIPGLGPADRPLVESILNGAGIPCVATRHSILVRVGDIAAVKQLLTDFSVSGPFGVGPTHPWQ
jgi:hypothetical protein